GTVRKGGSVGQDREAKGQQGPYADGDPAEPEVLGFGKEKGPYTLQLGLEASGDDRGEPHVPCAAPHFANKRPKGDTEGDLPSQKSENGPFGQGAGQADEGQPDPPKQSGKEQGLRPPQGHQAGDEEITPSNLVAEEKKG